MDILQELRLLLKKAKVARKKDDINAIQDVRDELSEALLYFGMTVVDNRMAAEKAKHNKEYCILEKEDEIINSLDGARGAVSKASREAQIHCKELAEKEIAAYSEYHKAKMILDRSDQILNSISSRLKVLLKNE